MKAPARILLIRPSALGDVCRTVPVLVSLRRAFPHADIDWLVQEGFEDAVAAHPALSRVVPFPRRRVALRRLWRPTAARTLAAFLARLGAARYDLVIDCQGLIRSGLFAWTTRAPRRIGDANARELGWIGLTERRRAPREAHTVDRMLDLARAAGAEPVRDMRLYTSPAGRAAIDPRLRRRRYAVVAPTSRWPGKAWPDERFAAATRALLTAGRVDAAAVVGADAERAHCPAMLELSRDDPRVIDLVGATSVGGLMAVVEHAAIVIANDSAALHMAVGFDRPMVGLFGPTRIDRVGPYARTGDVIQPSPPPPESPTRTPRPADA